MTDTLAAPPAHPPIRFGPIALSLSGGGYRAAAFHLGTIELLSHLGLLADVTTLSTVSGGTFTGVRYALSLKEGKTFNAFFDEFKQDITTVNLMELALEKLTHGAPPAIPSGRWDLITAFAQTYDEKLFGGRLFGVFWEGPAISLTDLIFNSTEFRTAVGFRFRKSDNTKARIGNGNIPLDSTQVRQLRLADIVAATSCFPGGFEPLNFPEDFHWPDTDIGRETLGNLRKKHWYPLPLMDGGVYDNQGMGSLLLSGSIPVEDYGLFIFSDTDRVSEPLFSFPAPRPSGWVRLFHLNMLSWFLVTLCLVSAFISFLALRPPYYTWPQILGFCPILLSISVAWTLLWLRSKIKNAFRAFPNLNLDYWKYLKRLRVNEFINLVEVRIASLFSLAADIFMRRIRRLVYDAILDNKDIRAKAVPNIIYDLTEIHPIPEGYDWLTPSEVMREVAATAKAMPTTLWFTNSQQAEDLIATGRMTLCYKLLLHIISLEDKTTHQLPARLQTTFDVAKELYLKLKQDPYAALSEKAAV